MNFSKLLALLILLLCVAIGMVGLILPVIPGFLFLLLALLLAAQLSPALHDRLSNSPWFCAYLNRMEGFSRLSLRGKSQLVCWFILKGFIDAVMIMVAALAWLLRFAFSVPERVRSN